jgi:BMFP domain-containing protein YqiC
MALQWGAIGWHRTVIVRSAGGGVSAFIDRARLERRHAPMQTRLLDEISARMSEFLAASPAKDLEKNLRAMLTAAFSRLDLATREEFEVQAKLLIRTRERLAEMESRVAQLEARVKAK